MSEAPPSDSGLNCPCCGYNMTAITSNRCPECGEKFILARPQKRKNDGSMVSNAMRCPDCQHVNDGFMPRACGHCGYRFSLRQRIFGVNNRLG